MTVKKALQLTEWLLQTNLKIREDLLSPEMPWNKGGSDSIVTKMVFSIALLAERDAKVLRAIRKELVPNCKHPKKMHDVCGDQKYCMNCNMDF
jgi:hypothetical protein